MIQGSNGTVDAVGAKNQTTCLYRVKGLCRIFILAWKGQWTQWKGGPLRRSDDVKILFCVEVLFLSSSLLRSRNCQHSHRASQLVCRPRIRRRFNFDLWG